MNTASNEDGAAWVVLIRNDARPKDKRRTCGHRHMSELEVVACRDWLLENEPEAQVFISKVKDAGPFLFPRF